MKTKVLAALLAVFLCGGRLSAQPALQYRLMWDEHNLNHPEEIPIVKDVIHRAKLAGYTALVLGDGHLANMDMQGQAYMDNLAEVLNYAAQEDLDVYPAIWGDGDATGLLAHDPNMAEGIPINNAVFQVNQDGTADVFPNPAITVPNADFNTPTATPFLGGTRSW